MFSGKAINDEWFGYSVLHLTDVIYFRAKYQETDKEWPDHP